MTFAEHINEYITELGWSVVELHNRTDIDIAVLQDILKGDTPMYSHALLIVMAITSQYPSNKTWSIYQTIMIQPLFNNKQTKAKQ